MTDVDILRGKRITVGDTLPGLRVQLIDAGDPINLSGFDVSMKMRRSDGDSPIVDETITVADESRGIVSYDWSADDTDESGAYSVEFVADDGSDTISFPSHDTALVVITEAIN